MDHLFDLAGLFLCPLGKEWDKIQIDFSAELSAVKCCSAMAFVVLMLLMGGFIL